MDTIDLLCRNVTSLLLTHTKIGNRWLKKQFKNKLLKMNKIGMLIPLK